MGNASSGKNLHILLYWIDVIIVLDKSGIYSVQETEDTSLNLSRSYESRTWSRSQLVKTNGQIHAVNKYIKHDWIQFIINIFSARITVNLFLILNQLGVLCVYVVFVSATFKSIIDDSLEKPIAIELYMLSFLCLFMLMMCIRNLRFLAPFSLVANLIALVTFSVIGYYIFQNLPNMGDITKFAKIYGYPLSAGTVLFAISAIGVVSGCTLSIHYKKGTSIYSTGMPYYT